MKRISIQPRQKWQQQINQLGFSFEFSPSNIWDESAYYEIKNADVERIAEASESLWAMCLNAVQHVISQKLYRLFDIPDFFVPHIEQSFKQEETSLYTSFNLVLLDDQIKLLSIDADEPRYLFESAIVQWYWLQDINPEAKQCNHMHEMLIEAFKNTAPKLKPGPLHFTCLSHHLDDLNSLAYLRDCAIQADIDTQLVALEDIGWAPDEKMFIDSDNEMINNILKVYPYHCLVEDEFAKCILNDSQKSLWIEPSWKLILNNKAILVILYELYPNHPYLLKTQWNNDAMPDFVQKPIYSQQGQQVLVHQENKVLESTKKGKNSTKLVYQELCYLPKFEDNYCHINSAMVGQKHAGIVMHESKNLISANDLRLVPHLIVN